MNREENLVEKIFGRLGKVYVPVMDTISEKIPNYSYTFRDISNFEEILKQNPDNGMKIYWIEILQRSHIVAISTILRQRRWVKGVISSFETQNAVSFAANFRGLIESAGDSYHTLGIVPLTLAEKYSEIVEALKGEVPENTLYKDKELEDKLIHFTHGRKIQSGDKDKFPKSHQAESSYKYRKELEESSNASVDECYKELCGIVHPAKLSVSIFFHTSEHSDRTKLSLDKENDLEYILDFSDRYSEVVSEIFMKPINSALLTLKTLNKFPASRAHTEAVQNIGLDDIPQWKKIKRKIKSQ